MNILVLSWRDPKHPLAGGAEQSVLEHAKGWIKNGNTVTWFSSRYRDSLPIEIIDGVKIVRQSSQYLGVQVAAFKYYLKNKDKYDLVVDQFHGIPFFTPLYVKKPKLALIQEVAGKVWFLNPLPKPINLMIGFLGFLFEPLIFKFYKNTQFITASNSAKEDIIKMGIPKNNIKVIPHGVIIPKYKSFKKNASTTKIVTYLGILSKDKGIEDAIEAFKILDKKGKYKFWVIGKGETKKYEGKIKKVAKPFGNKIKFWGYVSQRQKFELLAQSNILINPSVHEGWGLVNIEANAVGTPVVAYKSAGLVDSVKDEVSGVIVKQNTPNELAKAVNTFLLDRKRYEKLQKGAILWSRKFDWRVSRKMSIDLIEKVHESK